MADLPASGAALEATKASEADVVAGAPVSAAALKPSDASEVAAAAAAAAPHFAKRRRLAAAAGPGEGGTGEGEDSESNDSDEDSDEEDSDDDDEDEEDDLRQRHGDICGIIEADALALEELDPLAVQTEKENHEKTHQNRLASHPQKPWRVSALLVQKPRPPVVEDEDGDLEIPRRGPETEGGSSSSCPPETANLLGAKIKMRRLASSNLRDVGLQLWAGALVLSDFLLARPELFKGRTVCELGAGLGLCSLLAGRLGAQSVLCTDGILDAVENCEATLLLNDCLPGGNVRTGTVLWEDPLPRPTDPSAAGANPVSAVSATSTSTSHPASAPTAASTSTSASAVTPPAAAASAATDQTSAPSSSSSLPLAAPPLPSSSPHQPAPLDPTNPAGTSPGQALRVEGQKLSEMLWGAEVLMAADVVYDVPGAEKLASLVHLLLTEGSAKALYLAVEKRVYFSAATLRPEVTAYPQFIEDCESRGLAVEAVNLLDIPVFFGYVRSRFYELVVITAPKVAASPQEENHTSVGAGTASLENAAFGSVTSQVPGEDEDRTLNRAVTSKVPGVDEDGHGALSKRRKL